MIVEACKSTICWVGQQLETQYNSWCNSSLKAVYWKNSFSLRKSQFFSVKAFNWLDETHLIYGG